MSCRVCGGTSFGEVIDLGLMPLANHLLTDPDEVTQRWPLKVVFCRECSLGQLTEAPDPAEIFDEYCYFSSQSRTMLAHAGLLVSQHVRPGQRVVEIASNDGYLLRQAQARGATILGVDPARNIAEYACSHDVPTRCAYFDREEAAAIVDAFGQADVVFANNVLAHVPDPHEIIGGLKLLLADDGIAHIEVPYIVSLVEQCAFDTIYHEHQCYFSMSALRSLLDEHGLRITEVKVIEIHGGSLHLAVAHTGAQSAADQLCEQERNRGLFGDSYYAEFATRVERLGKTLIETINEFDTVAAYGAAAKGVMLLNRFGLGTCLIPWVADISPHKQGQFIPGTHQPIVDPALLVDEQPGGCLLLPWNLSSEIRQQNCEYVSRGGKFIVPIPTVAVL